MTELIQGIDWTQVREQTVELIEESGGDPIRGADRVTIEDAIFEFHDDLMPGLAFEQALDVGVIVEHCDNRYGFDLDSVSEDKDDSGSDEVEVDEAAAMELFSDVIDYYHNQLNSDISDIGLTYVDEDGTESVVDTPRRYYQNVRGWSDELIDAYKLGWAPRHDETPQGLGIDRDLNRETVIASGLAYPSLDSYWKGRFVMPYLTNDEVVYAISRSSPESNKNQKYDKIRTEWDDGDIEVIVDEPIFGLDTIEVGKPIIVTEGIADALTLHDHGYSAISPVTVAFKKSHHNRLLDIIDEYDIPRVYLMQDSERATVNYSDEIEGWRALTIDQTGRGLAGAIRTANVLTTEGVEAYIAEVPNPGVEKVDVDDYLGLWADNLMPVIASAKPARQHPAFEAIVMDTNRSAEDYDNAERESVDGDSAYFDLIPADVFPELRGGYRGPSPLGHHGNSDDYFQYESGSAVATDHKYPASYSGQSLLACKAEIRHPAAPNGRMQPAEVFEAWVYAKEDGIIASDDSCPRIAMAHVARHHGIRDDADDETVYSNEEYNAILDTIEETYKVDSGRRGDAGPWEFDEEEVSPFLTHPASLVVSYIDDESLPNEFELTHEGRFWTADGIRDSPYALALVGVIERYVEIEDLHRGWLNDIDSTEVARLCMDAYVKYDFVGEPPYRALLGISEMFGYEVIDEEKGIISNMAKSQALKSFNRIKA